MYFEPQAVPAEIVPLFRRFVTITTWKPWKARLAALEQQVTSNPLLREYFAERYSLELEIGRIHRILRRDGKIGLPATYQESGVLSFVATAARVHQRLSPQGQRRLAGMLRSGLDAEHGLTSFQHEMGIATHLMAQGFDVTFSDIQSGGGFDMLAEREGTEMEVECKTFSGDLGRKIHRRRLYQLGGHVLPPMVAALDRRPGGQFARILLTGRLQGTDQQLRNIHERLAKVLQDGRSDPAQEPCAVEYRTFSLAGSPFETMEPETLEREVVRQYIEREFGLPIGNVMMLFRPSHGAVVIAVESLQKDAVMPGLVRQLKQSVKHQFTGARPAVICVKFSDITEQELLEIGEQYRSGQPSALQIATNYLLNRDAWRHVHTLAYFAPGHLTMSRAVDDQSVTRSVQEQGQAYVFTNTHHDLAGDARLSIF